MRVLLIDDAPAYREEFAELLAEGGFAEARLDHLYDAADGARVLQAGEHDIYFVDYRLPGARGTDLIRQAREAGVERPIFCLTGLEDPRVDLEAEQAGASGYLPKGGFSPSLLGRTIRFALRQVAGGRMPKDAENRFRLAQDIANIGAWDWDISACEMTWDARMYQLYGCAPSGAISPLQAWQLALRPDVAASLEATARNCLEQGCPFQSDIDISWEDGSLHYLRAVGRVVRDPGRPARLTGITWDITELRQLVSELARARDAAERANQAKSRFLAGMSHELRTPLNAVLGYAELLQLEGGLGPAQLGRVRTMQHAGQHLLHMINQVLDMSAIEAGKIELHVAATDLPSLAASCLDLVRPQAEAKWLVLRLAPVAEPSASRLRGLLTDPTRLRQILLNLLGNAVKFTPRGMVEVRLREIAEAALLRVEVADTGPGVPADQLGRLFDDFVRLDNEATQATEGAGLGLALSARLAKLLGGRLGHEDRAGGGSVFWVELPWRATVASEPARPAEPTVGRRLRILLADDVEMNCDVAASMLRASGHEVLCVQCGVDAVRQAGSADFDIVLMDVRMPGMDGLQATQKIREMPGRRGQVPIIGVTALAFAEQVQACHDAGMNEHLLKPYSCASLLECVSRVTDIVPAGRY